MQYSMTFDKKKGMVKCDTLRQKGAEGQKYLKKSVISIIDIFKNTKEKLFYVTTH